MGGGLSRGWSHPVQSGRIQFDLPPGNYTLRIRAVSNEGEIQGV